MKHKNCISYREKEKRYMGRVNINKKTICVYDKTRAGVGKTLESYGCNHKIVITI